MFKLLFGLEEYSTTATEYKCSYKLKIDGKQGMCGSLEEEAALANAASFGYHCTVLFMAQSQSGLCLVAKCLESVDAWSWTFCWLSTLSSNVNTVTLK